MYNECILYFYGLTETFRPCLSVIYFQRKAFGGPSSYTPRLRNMSDLYSLFQCISLRTFLIFGKINYTLNMGGGESALGRIKYKVG